MMDYGRVIAVFGQFGLALLLGTLIGLERELREGGRRATGMRDFIFFALIGAVSAFLASYFSFVWLIPAGLFSVLVIVMSNYWSVRNPGAGITTELAAVIAFFLGVLSLSGLTELAIALAIVTLGVLFPKKAIKSLSNRVSAGELQAVLLFLTISFIVLPVLPNQTLDHYATIEIGKLTRVDVSTGKVGISLSQPVETETTLQVINSDWIYLGSLHVEDASLDQAVARYDGKQVNHLSAGQSIRMRIGNDSLYLVLETLNPYRIWLIVVLVSLISFLGYVLIKVMGSRAGVGLTGLIGGLVSSTLTTLSFARRGNEDPDKTPLYAAAIVLASSIMFPRLILEIGIFNSLLMQSIALPLAVMGMTGMVLALLAFRATAGQAVGAVPAVAFNNPFSLKSALGFALVFTSMLVITRLANAHLGANWLPLVAIISGLTDADAIAFSVSNLHRNGLISVEWASFNLVLGALSNTLMKLIIVFSLAGRPLFYAVFWRIMVIGTAGIISMLFYYGPGMS